MSKRDDTALELLRAAERLYAERGIHSVSLREIAAAAGQKNVSAVTYHFGSRDELLERILERHSTPMSQLFLERATAAESCPDAGYRPWLELLVHTLAAKLDDPDGGTDYLWLCAQLTSSPDFPLSERRAALAPGALALAQRLFRYSSKDHPSLFPLRWKRFAAVLYLGFADYMRLTKTGLPIAREHFIEDLIESLALVAHLE